MAHDVLFSIPPRALGRSDVEFTVRKNGRVVGTLSVSKGSLVWFPKRRSYGLKMRWNRFDEVMREHAVRHEKR